MLFSSAIFVLVFLPVVFFANLLITRLVHYPKNIGLSNMFLLLASLFFYAWGEPVYVLLMIFSILFNWITGILIGRSEGGKRTLYLTIGVICNLALLGHFKYTGFIVRIINGIAQREILTDPKITLPIGISFFTFQAMSYIIDVYRKDTEPSAKLTNVALYISFFPQLIAGPIVKYREINEQIISRKIEWISVSDGFKRFIYGLGKKVQLRV